MGTRNAVLLAACLSLLGAGALADAPPLQITRRPDCAQAPCRPARVHFVLLASDGKHVFDADMDPAPYIQNGRITIFPGETLIFHFSPTPDAPGVPVFAGVGTSGVPHYLAKDDPNVVEQHDPISGEVYYTAKNGSPLMENGTAEDHLKGQPPGTLILAYHQVPGRPDMVLSIEHNLDRPLKFHTEIERVPGSKMAPTSTCAAKPVLYDAETWPYPIAAIQIEDFRFIDTSDGLHCE